MAMFSSAASTSSRGSASEEGASGPSRLKNVGGPDGDDERNDFEETHKIQAGIFSVLYILSKENLNENLKFTIIKLMFDFTQLFALVVNPAHGWRVDSTSIYWQILTFSRWNFIVTNILGYKVYVAILYTMTGMLMSALALCVWIAYSYKNRSFAYTWPIYILRIYATIHFGLFDIATLTLIQVSYDCQFLGSGDTMRGRMSTFPKTMCYKQPHLIPFVVGLSTQVIFVVAAVIFFTGEFEVNPISRRFTCCAHSQVEVRAFLLKVAMTVVYVLVGWLQVQTAIQSLLCLMLTWIFFKNMPYMFALINHIRVGSYLAVSWAGILAVAILFKPRGDASVVHQYEQRITAVMLYGLGPIGVLGFSASYIRLNTWSKFVLKRFKEAPPGSKVKDIYRFKDPIEVEIISRVARHWIDDEVLDLERVKEAEAIIKAGLVLFPTRAFMIMLYSNFLWDVLDNPQAGYSQLQAAKKANPTYMERFAIYRREQEHLARTAQTKGNGESTLDLVSYVEFQRNYRLAMRAHREALVATRNFWQYLLQQHITFTHLSKSLNAIESSIVKADKVYRTVLERYPYSAKMIKGYARFLEGIKNDPWRASKFYTEAEKLEAEREEEAAALELEGLDGDDSSRLLNKVDERVNAVVIINSRGQIQMANKLAYALFGYNKGELEGKNVAMLMPLPFSQRHNGYIKRHITTGRETVMNRVTDLVALHKDRYVFPFRLAVSKVSGAGDDSLFMGVIMSVENPIDTANVYVLSGGSVAAVDQAFVDWFGYTVEDYLGHPAHTLAVDPLPFKRIIEQVAQHDQPSEDGVCPFLPGTKNALIKHKYTDPVEVSLRLKATGVGTETIFRIEMKRLKPPVELILTNRKGRICFITSPQARALGHTPRSLRKVDIGELLPQPFGALHAAWIREAAESKPLPHSCRSSVTMVIGPTPKTQQTVLLAIKSTDESGEQQHVVKISPSSVAEGLDERRLRLTIDTAGFITDVGASPTSLFGFKPTALLGRSLADCVDVLHHNARAASIAAATANGGGANGPAVADAAASAELRKIITLLMGRALERPGVSWRVGVMPPLENIRSLGSIATALLAKQTRPAIMELDVKVDLEDLAAGRDVSINISLWRADLLCGVLEVDKEGVILTSQDHPFYPSGLLFGISSPSLLRQPLGRFLQLGTRTVDSLFASEHKSGGKKGALKSSSAPLKKVGPLRTLQGSHSDGETLPLTVQLVRKEGANSRSYVVLHLKDPTRGSRDFLMHLQRGPVEARAAHDSNSDASVTAAGGVPAAVGAAGVAAARAVEVLVEAGGGGAAGKAAMQRRGPPGDAAATTVTVDVVGAGGRFSPLQSPPPPTFPSQQLIVHEKPPLPPQSPSRGAAEPPLPPQFAALKAAATAALVSSGSGGRSTGSGDAPSICTPPKDDSFGPSSFILPTHSDFAYTVLLPVPPLPQRVVSTPVIDQPRVAGGRMSSTPTIPPTTPRIGTRWSMGPPAPAGLSDTLDALAAVATVSGGVPPPPPLAPSGSPHVNPVGQTLQEYLIGGPEKSEDDLATLFDKALETDGSFGGVGVGGGGMRSNGQFDGISGGGSGGSTLLRPRPSVRRMAPNMRTAGSPRLGFNAQMLSTEMLAAAGFGHVSADMLPQPPTAVEGLEAMMSADAFAHLSDPSLEQPPPTPPLAGAQGFAVQNLAQQVPAAAAGLNALSAAVVRATTPLLLPPAPPATAIVAALPPRPNRSPSVAPPPQPASPLMRSPPPPSPFILTRMTSPMTSQQDGSLHGGGGGGPRVSSGSVGGMLPSPFLLPRESSVLSASKVIPLAHSSSLPSRRVGSEEYKTQGAGLPRTASRDSAASSGKAPGQSSMRRSITTKQVSFAPSQMLIDESGHVERQPSYPQINTLTPRSGSAVLPTDGDDDTQPYGKEPLDNMMDGVMTEVVAAAGMSTPSHMMQYGSGGYGGYGGGNDDAYGAYGKVRSNVKLARIREWVMTEGERYFRLEDVQNIGDTVYPFGPDLLLHEDSRASHALVLNGNRRDADDDGDGDDEVEAAPSRWAEADGADDADDMRDLDEALPYGGSGGFLESASRDLMGRGAKEGKFNPGGDGDGDDCNGGKSSHGGADDASEMDGDDDSRSGASASGGQAASSTGSGTGVASSSAQADFRRGKRCRKLLKMLSTPAVQRATLAFRWQALLAIAVQLLANLACFVLLTVLLIRQTRGLRELNKVGQSVVSCHDTMLALQVMDNIYSSRVQAGVGLYDRNSITRLSGDLKTALDRSWYSHNDVYLGTHRLSPLPTAYNLSALWNDYNHQELLFYGPTATDRRSTSLWRLGNAFLRQGFELHHRHRNLVDQLGTLAASDQYKYIHSNGLFELFSGYQLTLNALVYQAVDTSNTINRLQLVLLVIEGCCICALVVAYMAWLLKKVDNQRYGMYGVFLIVPVGLVRGLASKAVAVEEENSDGEEEPHDEGGGEDSGVALHGGTTGVPHSGGERDYGAMRINLDASTTSSGRRSSSSYNPSGLRLLYDRIAFWRHASVRHGKRTMLRNSKESLWLLAPFVVWGLVVVVMHSLGYVTMEQASAPVAMTNVVNTVLTRLHRVVYFAQELAGAGNEEAQRALYPVLETEVAALKAEWDVMLYGANASQIADPHFSLARRGVAFELGATTDTLFSPGVSCWMPLTSDCYPSDHPYSAVVYRGLNAMMQRFFVESDLMLRDEASAWDLTSTRLDYLYHEGTGNLHWALIHFTDVHLEAVVALYMRVEVFHVVVFVLSWLLAGLFLFGMLRPFMGHTQRETERIAEMLSQLPADVDVEGLLNKALISIKGEGAYLQPRASEQRMGRNRVAPLVEPGGFPADGEGLPGGRPGLRVDPRMASLVKGGG